MIIARWQLDLDCVQYIQDDSVSLSVKPWNNPITCWKPATLSFSLTTSRNYLYSNRRNTNVLHGRFTIWITFPSSRCIFTTYVAKECASDMLPYRGHHSTNNARYTCSNPRWLNLWAFVERNSAPWLEEISFPALELSSTVTLLAETIGRKSQHLCGGRYLNLWTTWIKLTPRQKLNGFPSPPYGQVSTMTTECRQEPVSPVTVRGFPYTPSPTRRLHIASSPLAVVRPCRRHWALTAFSKIDVLPESMFLALGGSHRHEKQCTCYMLQRMPCCVALVPNWLSSIRHHGPRATNWA